MVLVLRSHVKLLGGEQCFCWIMLLLLCSNVVLIWYRCINLLWPHRYWNMLAKEMCGKSYPGLLRLLQWSKRNQFPERSPLTREQPHCLDRQNWWYGKNVESRQLNQNGIYLPFGSPGKIKILIVNASDLKYDLTLFSSPRAHCFNLVLQWKIQKTGVFTIEGILLFRLSTDIPNKLTLEIRLSSLRTQTLFSSPSSACQQ